MVERGYAVLGPLTSKDDGPDASLRRTPSRISRGGRPSELGCEVVDGLPRSDLPVVLLHLPAELTEDTKRFSRSLREVAFATRLDHPGILRVHGVEHYEHGWVRITDFANGEPLDRMLDLEAESAAALAPEIAARIVLDVAAAVHYAHEAGARSVTGRPAVHGGIRPDTVLIGFDGRTQLGGWGAASLAPSGEERKEWAAFSAPEQILGGRGTTSVTTDVYALGALLHALVEGRRPFHNARDLDSAVLSQELPAVAAEEDLTGRLRGVIRSAMGKRGSDRPATAEALAEEIRRALTETGQRPAPPAAVGAWVEVQVPSDDPDRSERRRLLDQAAEVEPRRLDPTPFAAEELDAEVVASARPVHTRERSHSSPPRDSALPSTTDLVPPYSTGPTLSSVGTPAADLGSTRAPEEPPPSDPLAGARAAAPPLASSVPTVVPEPSGTVPMPQPAAPQPASTPGPSMARPASVDVPPSAALPGTAGYPAGWVPTPMATADVPTSASAPTGWPPPPVGYAYVIPMRVDPRTGYPVIVPLDAAPVAAATPTAATHNPMRVPTGSESWPPSSVREGSLPVSPAEASARYVPPAGVPTPVQPLPPPAGVPTPVQPLPARVPSPAAHPAAGYAAQLMPAGPRAGQSFLADAQAESSGDLLSNQPVRGLPAPAQAVVREVSSRITAFNRTAGDGSRSLLYIALAAAFGGIMFVLVAPGEAPEAPEAGETKVAAAAMVPAVGEPPRPVKPAPAKAPEGPVGALKVLSEPAVDVYVDGERLGRTPLDTELPTGKTTLRLTDRRTGINVYRTVLLDPERPARIDELFETGELVVRAPRGAHIHLNGRFLGEAPLNGPAKIYEGPCLLKVTYEGMRWTERFNAEAGRRVSFDVEEKRL